MTSIEILEKCQRERRVLIGYLQAGAYYAALLKAARELIPASKLEDLERLRMIYASECSDADALIQLENFDPSAAAIAQNLLNTEQ